MELWPRGNDWTDAQTCLTIIIMIRCSCCLQAFIFHTVMCFSGTNSIKHISTLWVCVQVVYSPPLYFGANTSELQVDQLQDVTWLKSKARLKHCQTSETRRRFDQLWSAAIRIFSEKLKVFFQGNVDSCCSCRDDGLCKHELISSDRREVTKNIWAQLETQPLLQCLSTRGRWQAGFILWNISNTKNLWVTLKEPPVDLKNKTN